MEHIDSETRYGYLFEDHDIDHALRPIQNLLTELFIEFLLLFSFGELEFETHYGHQGFTIRVSDIIDYYIEEYEKSLKNQKK